MLLATTMLTATAQAQQAGPPDTAVSSPATASAAPADPTSGGDIIVTATKRSESLQNVPISIQALGTETLAQHQVANLDDYVKLLPSVSYQSFGPGQSQIYFRGIVTGGDGLASGPLPTTGLYIDETPVTTIAGSVDIHAYDMARVEALSGPQGTLYGASSLSGTLRLITNKPDTSRLYGAIDVQGDKYGPGGYGGTAEGFINIPLNENIALRVVGFYERQGGYIDNLAVTGRIVQDPTTGTYLYNQPYQRPHTLDDGSVVNSPYYPNNSHFAKNNFNTATTYGGRAALKVDLNDNWTMTPGIIYQHLKTNGTFLYDPRVGDLAVHDFTPDYDKDHWYLASMTLQGKVSDWDVTYSGSYFQRTVDQVQDYSYFSVAYDSYTDYNYYKDAAGNDLDPTQIIHGHDRYTKQSHELRISSPADYRLRLTAGAFMQRQTDQRTADYILPGLSTASVAFNSPIPGAPQDDVFYTSIHRVDRDYAMFAEAAYDILPNLTLNAGIRGFMANNTLSGFSGTSGSITNQNATNGCQPLTVQGCPNVDKKYVQSGETHKVNLSWKIDHNRMVYFTYSTGFRPGGNNRDAFALGKLQSLPPYQADTLTNYEVGWKTSWFNHTLRFNGALFWEDWSKVQYSEPGLLGIFYTVNAGSARSRGVEGDISWTLFRHLTLSTSGTYADAKLTSNFAGSDGTILAPSGTRLPVNPRFKINGNARYEFKTGELRDFVQASVSHQSGTTSYLTTAGEAVLGPTSGFTTFDFSGGTAFGNYTLSAFIQNAFDKRGILSKNGQCAPTLCGQYARLYPIKPQYFGLKMGMKF
ncbi:TonB-dependent receptor [Sphingomonas nostoxanthinifaciens]|nr:TonB-dependent receptor [Sphingomonas nostoxanthinifaciens]